MRVDGLWRYPVKSLGGERLTAAALTEDGVAGDALVAPHGGRLVADAGPARFDVLNLLVATDGACGRTSSSAASDRARNATGRITGAPYQPDNRP